MLNMYKTIKNPRTFVTVATKSDEGLDLIQKPEVESIPQFFILKLINQLT